MSLLRTVEAGFFYAYLQRIRFRREVDTNTIKRMKEIDHEYD